MHKDLKKFWSLKAASGPTCARHPHSEENFKVNGTEAYDKN